MATPAHTAGIATQHNVITHGEMTDRTANLLYDAGAFVA
jgi:hypothetical protein